MSDSIKSRNFSITFIQVISAISVVCLHTNGCFWQFSTTERYWRTANIIESVFYFAVPLFFMITGITLINYQDRYSTAEFFKKRFFKAFLPYIVWSLIRVIYLIFIVGDGYGKPNFSKLNIKYIINGLLSGDSIINVYWFFPALYCVYLSLPLFASIDKNKRKTVFSYLVCTGFFINNFIPFVKSVFSLDFSWPYSIAVSTGYLLLAIEGYLLYNYPPKKGIRYLLYTLAVIGLTMHIKGTRNLSLEAGEIIRVFKGYCNVPCILYSTGVFLLLYEIGKILEKNKLINKVVCFLGQYTFVLYLLHWYAMELIVNITHVNTKWIVYRLGAPFVILAIVIGITWILRKIPVIRNTVP